MRALYQQRRIAKAVDVPVQGLNYRVHTWGSSAARPLFMLHGWADTGLSFQFLVDEWDDAGNDAEDYFFIAPDWRGFGDTDRVNAYWFPDYLLDLDILLDRFACGRAAALLGHSMGANIAGLYAGIRPQRVTQLIAVDGLGMLDKVADEAPGRYAKWLRQMRSDMQITDFADWDALAAYIITLAPGISAGRAGFIARTWGRGGSDGRIRLKTDPRHKRLNPVLYRRAESMACWRRIRARTALILAQGSRFFRAYEAHDWRAECRACIPQLQEYVIADSGHMLHLEKPRQLAGLAQRILAQP